MYNEDSPKGNIIFCEVKKMKAKNPFVSDAFLDTKVEITPRELGDAINEAIGKSVCDAPPMIREKLASMYAMFGATVMTELLYVKHGMDPDQFKDEGDKTVEVDA